MNPIDILKKGLSAIVVVVIASLVLGVVFGQPILLSYVETESMSPTLEPGDGFVAIPSQVSGDVEEGDVIVFDAQELHDGGLVTHRVVEATEQGYITRGDANVVTDQDGAEPPVQESQIKAEALQLGGEVVVIPMLGTIVMGAGETLGWVQQFLAATFGTRALLGTQGVAYLMIAFGVLTYLLASLADHFGERKRVRPTTRRTGIVNPLTVIAVMTVLLMVLLTTSMVAPSGTHQFQIVSSETDSDAPGVIQQGTNDSVTYHIPSNGPLPVVGIIEPTSGGVQLNQSTVFVPGGTAKAVTVTLHAPSDTGVYTRSIHEYRYLAFLPTDVILPLHAMHPWLPIVTINLFVGTMFAVIAVLLVGIDPVRISRRRNPIPLRVRLRRWLK